jgi:hypothetical protein
VAASGLTRSRITATFEPLLVPRPVDQDAAPRPRPRRSGAGRSSQRRIIPDQAEVCPMNRGGR